MTLPVCTRSEWEDIGHGVQMRRAFQDGVLRAIEYQHPSANPHCGNGDKGDYVPCGTSAFDVQHHWRLESEHPLTLSPSLLCPLCKHHGCIRAGRWVPA